MMKIDRFIILTKVRTARLQAVSVVVLMGALSWASVRFMTGSAASPGLVESPISRHPAAIRFWIRSQCGLTALWRPTYLGRSNLAAEMIPYW
jgi:hypothetical protein